jgi:hypothetical protein
MMRNYPDFSAHDNDDYYYYPSSNRKYYQQQCAAEQARRYRRMKEAEEQELRRQNYLRRLQRHQQEEEAYRRAYEAARCRSREAELRPFSGLGNVEDEEKELEEEPNFRLVQGLDGNLYRIKAGAQKREIKQLSFFHDENDEEGNIDMKGMTSSRVEANMSKNDEALTPLRSNKKFKKKVTIIVEDASDSETEDECKSDVWRNRRPSPGQWMEPVAGF